MKVSNISTMKDGRVSVYGTTTYSDEIHYKVGDVLVCGNNKWEIMAVNHFFQGCFSEPIKRMHSVILSSIGNHGMPNVGDELNKVLNKNK